MKELDGEQRKALQLWCRFAPHYEVIKTGRFESTSLSMHQAPVGLLDAAAVSNPPHC
ncbi:hypothetical protein P3T18_001127 [Paraburkholderia sp. GAS199]|uniref:hypothetical protein n=1 Tax=Paraburkholderia sp. GAS199 TaxID=3035126 RepID=UPI003D263235